MLPLAPESATFVITVILDRKRVRSIAGASSAVRLVAEDQLGQQREKSGTW
jgi:hypothetical protein